MRKIKSLLLIFVFSMMFIVFQSNSVNAIDNFEINDLNVQIVVNEDGTYDVSEKYTMNYTQYALGFYRDIPTYYKFLFKDGYGNITNKQYSFPVTDVKLIGDVYDIENNFDALRIIVGPDEYGKKIIGEKDYEITYKVHTQSLNLPSQEEAFFQNLVSGWTVPIHNFNAKVIFPKPVDLSKMVAKGDGIFGPFDPNCTVDNVEINCSLNTEIILGQSNGITVNVPLADDYFQRATLNSTYSIFVAISLLGLVLTLLFKALIGQRLPLIEKVTFKAPAGFNSVMVGYLYNSGLTMNKVHSLFFEWASNGYITIDERKDNLYFIKVKDLETDIKTEQVLFHKLFPDNEEYTTTKWSNNNAYNDFANMMSKVPKEVKNKVTMFDQRSTYTSSIIQNVMIFILFAFNFVVFKFTLVNSWKAVVVGAVVTVVTLVPYIISSLIAIKHKRDGKYQTELFIHLAISLVIPVLAYLLHSLNILGIRFDYILYTITIYLIYLTFIFAGFIKVRTQAGSDLYGEVLGLRNFIKYAKYDELIVMQNENPSLYYDVLPYAYAFNMSDLWIEHFKNIEIPQSNYYRSYNPSYTNYMLMRTLTRSMNRTTSEMLPKTTSGRGGGSFSGGGFGGGFSGGGGFGGGGGGGR